MNGLNSINFNSQIPSMQSQMAFGRVSNLESTNATSSFKDVLTNMVSTVNEQMNKPDDLLAKAASGTGEVDVHDVMISMSQAEITLTVATNAVSKVIQAYDKIVQIQV
ncbi:flagellar hook-basal body complex protein FliE [bacterium]|nr:flagellar hook-basal body complex protein FliE [bacterium]